VSTGQSRRVTVGENMNIMGNSPVIHNTNFKTVVTRIVEQANKRKTVCPQRIVSKVITELTIGEPIKKPINYYASQRYDRGSTRENASAITCRQYNGTF